MQQALLHEILTNIQIGNNLLQKILDGLHDVKIAGFANVRVMDITGEFPIPSSVASGLLVSAFAGNATHVIVDGGHLDTLNRVGILEIINQPLNIFQPITVAPSSNPLNVVVQQQPIQVSTAGPLDVVVTEPVVAHCQSKGMQTGRWLDWPGRELTSIGGIYNSNNSFQSLGDFSIPLAAPGGVSATSNNDQHFFMQSADIVDFGPTTNQRMLLGVHNFPN